MLFNLKLRTELLAQLACIVTLGIFFLSATGCGKKSNSKVTDKTATTATLPADANKPTDVTNTADIIQASSTPAPQSPVVKPVPVEVSFAEAESAYKSGDYERSVALYEVYVNNHDTNPWGHYMLGLSAMKSGDTELALTSFNNSLTLDSTHVKSWLNMSRALIDENRTEEALVSLAQVFEIEPESSEAYRLKGRSLHALGRLEDAADAYRDALRIDDRDVWSMNNLALILMEQKHFELAIPSLARATQIRDDIAFIYNNLGMALERTYRFRAAEEAYAAAVAIDAAHSRASTNLARVASVTQDPGVEPVDLDRMAVNFIDEIQSWGDEYIDRELPLTAREELANEL